MCTNNKREIQLTELKLLQNTQKGGVWKSMVRYHMVTHTHTRLTALFPGLPRWAGTRKVTPIWILVKQETVSGSGISWAVCKSAPHSRQITMPAPHHSVFFTGRMPFLPPNQQRQSTEGNTIWWQFYDIFYVWIYTGWQWRRLVPYLWQLVIAAILWVKLVRNVCYSAVHWNTLCRYVNDHFLN